MEGLLWTVVWLLARKANANLSQRKWAEMRSVHLHAAPIPACVRRLLASRVGGELWTLLHPSVVVAEFPDPLCDELVGQWIGRVRALERERERFPCPDEILTRVFESKQT